MLENFDAEICDSLLGINKSAEIISQLLNKNIFIQQFQLSEDLNSLNQPHSRYAYQPLFRKFLNAKLNELRNKEEIKSILKKISLWYSGENDKISSIQYSLRAEDYEKAINGITEVSPKMLEEDKLELLWSWLNEIPEENILKNPYMLFVKANLHRHYTGYFEKALYYINHAVEQCKLQKKYRYLTECLILKSDVLLITGKDKGAFEILESLAKTDNTPEDSAKIYYGIARIYYSRGPFTKAIEFLNKSLDICIKIELTPIKNSCLQLLSSILLIRGEFIKSDYYSKQVDISSEAVYKKFRHLSVVIFMNAYMGRLETAKMYLDESYKNFEVYSVEHFQIAFVTLTLSFVTLPGTGKKVFLFLKRLSLLQTNSAENTIYTLHI